MTDQLISFETAKLAKEKGFDLISKSFFEHPIGRFERPTQSLLAKWLRETHHINIGAVPAYGGYTYWTKDHYNVSWTRYKSYEDALEQGLIEALKLIP